MSLSARMTTGFQSAIVAGVVGIVALTTGPARAQVPGADVFARDRGTSVQQRTRPAYQALGVRIGIGVLYPRIEVSGQTTDNLYAASQAPVADTSVRIQPGVSIESDRSRHAWTVFARGSVNRYRQTDEENTDEATVGGEGRIELTRQADVGFGAQYRSEFEPRTAPSSMPAAIRPTRIVTTQAHVNSIRTSGRVRLSARADWRSLDYRDTRSVAGDVIDQDGRDRTIASATARMDLAISPSVAVFLQTTGNARRYAQDPEPSLPSRDSDGAEFLGGTEFEIGSRMRGQAAVGYLKQDFASLGFADVSGFGGQGQIEWFPSGLTTVTVAAGRKLDDTQEPGAGAFVSTSASVGIDHELLRSVILTGRLMWSRDAYSGIDREDTRTVATAGFTYLLNRRLGLNASVSSQGTRSAGASRSRDFDVTGASLSLVFQI